MIWQPKKTKFKRLHKGTLKKCRYKKSCVTTTQGVFGLKVLKSVRLNSKQLEQVRRKIISVRKKKEKQKIWFRCIPDIPVTAKPLGIRMGKGKGNIKYWTARVPAGKIVFQLNMMKKKKAFKALRLAKKILPMPTKTYMNKYWLNNNVRFKYN